MDSDVSDFEENDPSLTWQKLDSYHLKFQNSDSINYKYFKDVFEEIQNLSFDLDDPNFPLKLQYFTNSISGSPSGLSKQIMNPELLNKFLTLFLKCDSMNIIQNVVLILAVVSHDLRLPVSDISEQIVQRVIMFLDDLEPSYGDFCQNLLIFSGNLCFDVEGLNSHFLENDIFLKTSNLCKLKLKSKESKELYDILYWFLRTLTIHRFDPKYISSFEQYIKIVLSIEYFNQKAIENALQLLISLQSHSYHIHFTLEESLYLHKLHLYQSRRVLSFLLQYLVMDGVEETCSYVVDYHFIENISVLIIKKNVPIGKSFFRILSILAMKYSLYPNETDFLNYFSNEGNNSKKSVNQNEERTDKRPKAILVYPAIIKCLIEHSFSEKIEAAKYICVLFHQESFEVRKLFLNIGIFPLIMDQLDDTNNLLFPYYSEILYKIGEASEFYSYDLTSEICYLELAEKYAQFSLEENLDEKTLALIHQVQNYFKVEIS